MTTLATQTEDHPDWCPPGVWPRLREEVVLAKNHCTTKSLSQIATEFGVTENQVRSMLNLKRYGMDMEMTRQALAEASMVTAHKTQRLLQAKLDDPLVQDKLSARDVSIIHKQAVDNTLNLSNGMVGAPTLTFDMRTAIQILNKPIAKPGE